MAPVDARHRRAHGLVLISKLLNQIDGTSPFTLVLDGLEQSGGPLLSEYIKRAHGSKITTIFVSFETLRKPEKVDRFVEAWSLNLPAWQSEVAKQTRSNTGGRNLVIIDSLNSLCASERGNIPAILSSFITPTTSLLAVYHVDVPLASARGATHDDYSPSPLTLLQYLATTIFATHSFPHVLLRKTARERSLVDPSFGLQEGAEGIIQGLGANHHEGLVFEMEHRRKSGRGVRETYFLTTQSPNAELTRPKIQKSIMLLEEHPLYRAHDQPQVEKTSVEDQSDSPSTFELGLTERQRKDREAVVLPYFDAQKGSGEGGRILYSMGEEDDFDEEEDEI